MAVAAPTKLIEAFAAAAPTCPQSAPVAGGRTFPFPITSQVVAGFPGNASLDTGFTPANMTPLNQSGLPMSGPDLQGILFLATSNVAALSAGQVFNVYDATYAAAIGGYAAGAILQKVGDVSAYWISQVANNGTNPDTGGAGWASSTPLYIDNIAGSGAISVGTNNNVVLAGPSDYIYDVDTTAGAVVLTGFVSQRHAQRLVITNKGTNTLAISSLTGSSAANQIRCIAGGLFIPQYGVLTLYYSATLSLWVPV